MGESGQWVTGGGWMGIRNYTDLIAWQKAMDLVQQVYAVSAGFPKEEVYGLTSQVRRAAVSVPANIAEGQGRRSDGDFRRFLLIAHGSLREMETLIFIAERLAYVCQDTRASLIELSTEVGRLINGLVNATKKGTQP
jgi:four helix bundle protein